MKTRLFIWMLLAVASVSVGVAQTVAAAGTKIGVQVRGADFDYCPNIPGQQTDMPAGMVYDNAGNCVTPPEPVVDVCSNIDGVQATPPVGYYWRSSDNTCQPQSQPPVDVCPNLDGIQTSVPGGYVFDAGNCVPPPTDVCANIPGVQTYISAGMVRSRDGVCATPTAGAGAQPGDTSASGATATTDDAAPTPTQKLDKVIADANQDSRPSPARGDDGGVTSSIPFLEWLGGLFPIEFREWLSRTPIGLARSIPYGLIAAMALAALGLFLVSLSYLSAANAFLLILGKQRRLAEEKDGFIMLVSHYLRTPLTLLRGGLEGLVAQEVLPRKQTMPLGSAVEALHGDIDEVVDKVQNNQVLSDIRAPEEEAAPKITRTLWFIVPVVGSVVLTIVANFLFGVVGGINLGGLNLVAQVILAVCVVMILYTSVRNYETRKRNKQLNEQLVKYENAIDDARTAFINDVTTMLDRDLARLDTTATPVAALPEGGFYREGRSRFEDIHRRLELLALIRTDTTLAPELIDIRQLTDVASETIARRYPDKQVEIDNALPSLAVRQDPRLFGFVIESILDNAVKFSSNGERVQIRHLSEPQQVQITFIDTGEGIDAARIEDLFKPFSRATDVEQFDHEGLGFSLFLDRIIMEHTGGNIQLESVPGKGTRVTVTTPLESRIK